MSAAVLSRVEEAYVADLISGDEVLLDPVLGRERVVEVNAHTLAPTGIVCAHMRLEGSDSFRFVVRAMHEPVLVWRDGDPS